MSVSLYGELLHLLNNKLQTSINSLLQEQHKLLNASQNAELKNLSSHKEKKLREQNSYELQRYKEVSHQLLEWFLAKHLPTVEKLKKKITAIIEERSEKNECIILSIKSQKT